MRFVPEYKIAQSHTTTSVFNGCSKLVAIGEFDNSTSTGASSFFAGCTSLEVLGNVFMSSATNNSSFFSGCTALREIGVVTGANTTAASSIFQNCHSLKKIGGLVLGATTNTASLFASCYSLIEDVAVDCSTPTGGTPFTNMYFNCFSMTKVHSFGFRRSISFQNSKLDRDAIVDIFNNLGTSSPAGQIVNVVGTPGASDLTAADELIATTKGWTVQKV